MASIIIAVLGLLGSFLTFYFTKRQQLISEQRKLKQVYYQNFIKALSDVVVNDSQDAQKRLAEGFNSLIVIGAPKVIQRLMKFHDFIRVSNAEIPRDSKEWSERHDELLRLLIKAIREDIYGREKDLDSFLAEAHLVSGVARKRTEG